MNQPSRDILNAVNDYLANAHPRALFAYLYGSQVKGTATARSDIDLLVIYEEPISQYRHKEEFKGRLFDTFIYDIESVNGLIHLARSGGDFIVINSILGSITVPQESEASRCLRETARLLKKSGEPIRNLTRDRQHLTSLVEGLEHERDADLVTVLASELLTSVFSTALRIHGEGGVGRREMVHLLRERDPQLCQALLGAYKSIPADGSAALVAMAWKFIDTIGGPLRAPYKASLPNIVRMPLPVSALVQRSIN